MFIRKWWPRWLLLLLLAGVVWGTAMFFQNQVVQAKPTEVGGAGRTLYIPLVQKPQVSSASCVIPNQSYASLPIIPPPSTGIPAEEHPDFNLAVRGYEPTNAPLELVTYGPPDDPKAPQLDGLFADRRLPDFTNAYQRYRWDWDCDCITDTQSQWDATVLGLGTTPGETIHVPIAGYDIGGGYNAQVLYASEERITLHYALQDDLSGYVFHIEDVCVDPNLLALYEKLNSEGRNQLPVLANHQPFGVAYGSEIKVATRDTGSFMDPRDGNSWWLDH